MNPNWPVMDEAVSFPASVGTAAPYPYWVSVVTRSIHNNKTSRGRQYELNIVQTGEYTCTLDNRDGALSSLNTASPYAPVLPYVPYRKRAQWSPTQNLLTQDQAAGGLHQAAGVNFAAVAPNWLVGYSGYWNVVAEPDAFYGTNVFAWNTSTAPSAPLPILDVNGASLQPQAPSISLGLTGWHSAQAQVRCTSGTSGSLPAVSLRLVWRTISGTVLSDAEGTAVTLPVNSRVWVPITVSGQAPVGACGFTTQLYLNTPQACTIEASGFQVEWAQTPSTWTLPGVWY